MLGKTNEKKLGLLAVAIFILCLLFLANRYVTNEINNQSNKKILQSLSTVLKTTHAGLQAWMHENISTVEYFAQHEEVIKSTHKLLKHGDIPNNPELETVRTLFRSVLSSHDFYGFFIHNKELINLASSRDKNLGIKTIILTESKMNRLKRGESIIVLPQLSKVPLTFNPSLGSGFIPTMFVISPIKDKNKILGFLSFRINPLGDFSRLFQRGRLGDSGETYGVNSKGVMISNSRFDHELEQIGLISLSEKSLLNIMVNDPGKNLLNKNGSLLKQGDEKQLTVMAKNVTQKRSGFNIVGYRDYRGVDVIGIWLWDDALEFGMTTEQDVDEAFYVNKLTIRYINYFTLLIGLLFICLYFVFLRSRQKLEGFNQTLKQQVTEGVKQIEESYEKTKKQAVLLEEQTKELAQEKELLFVKTQELEKASKYKTEFLANMSHELRTPLNAILGYSQLLTMDFQDNNHEDYIEDISKIHRSGEHLLSLINNVLDISKVESGQEDLYIEEFFIDDFLNEIVESVKPLTLKNRNELSFTNNLGNISVSTDKLKLKQCLMNLISNAAKFTKNGRIKLNVTSQRKGDAELFFFEVVDTGIGMTGEQMTHIFEAFTQADKSTTKNYGGTGLGLSISKKYSLLLGGDITLTSKVGEGSSFILSVKNQKIQPVAGENLVLVIDDNADVQTILSRFLKKAGYVVITASNGIEGLELSKKYRPNIIILDVMMPGIDGWQVLDELKSHKDLKDIPVVMLTMVSDKKKGFLLGAAEFLQKPIHEANLLETLGKYSSGQGSKSVLVVDDSDQTRSLISRFLAGKGMDVIEAENGEEAIKIVKSDLPDIIILDLLMPVLNGFEFILEFRKIEGAKSIPIIVSTAKDLSPQEMTQLKDEVSKINVKGSRSLDNLLEDILSTIQSQMMIK